MRFKPGQKVLCVKRDQWISQVYGTPSIGPKFNEEVQIERLSNTGSGYLLFIEYRHTNKMGTRDSYDPKWFEPLITDSQLKKELETIEQFV